MVELIRTLIFIVIGTVLLLSVVRYSLKVVLPFMGSLPGYIYLFFDWVIYMIKQGTSIILTGVNEAVNRYVFTFWFFSSLWLVYVVVKIWVKSLQRFGASLAAVGVAAALTGVFLGVSLPFLSNVVSQMETGQERITGYIYEVNNLTERVFNPYPFWVYSHVVAKTNKTLKEYIRGISRAYFFSKSFDTISGKIASIVFVGNHTCDEIYNTIKEGFQDVVRDNGFLMFKCEDNGPGNYSISIYNTEYPFVARVTSENVGGNPLGAIIDEEDENFPIFLKDNTDYVCYVDYSISEIFNSEGAINVTLNDHAYCEVPHDKVIVYLYSEIKEEALRTYILDTISSNITSEEIVSDGYLVREVGGYSIIPPAILKRIMEIGNDDVKYIYAFTYLGKPMKYLIVIAKKV